MQNTLYPVRRNVSHIHVEPDVFIKCTKRRAAGCDFNHTFFNKPCKFSELYSAAFNILIKSLSLFFIYGMKINIEVIKRLFYRITIPIAIGK